MAPKILQGWHELTLTSRKNNKMKSSPNIGMQVCRHGCIHVIIQVCLHVSMCPYVHVCTNAYMRTYMHACVEETHPDFSDTVQQSPCAVIQSCLVADSEEGLATGRLVLAQVGSVPHLRAKAEASRHHNSISLKGLRSPQVTITTPTCPNPKP